MSEITCVALPRDVNFVQVMRWTRGPEMFITT